MTDDDPDDLADAMWQTVEPMFDEPYAAMLGPRHPIKRSGPRELICVHVRELVFQRDNGSCRLCHLTDKPFEIDHIVPWSAMGPSTTSNLQLLCQECNQEKSNRRTPMPQRPPIVTACSFCNAGAETGPIRAWCARCKDFASVTAAHVDRTDALLLRCCDIPSWNDPATWPPAKRPPARVLHDWLDAIFAEIDKHLAGEVDPPGLFRAARTAEWQATYPKPDGWKSRWDEPRTDSS